MPHTQSGLPFAGSPHVLARHRSAGAAEHAARRRGVQTERYLALLARAPEVGFSDHEAATALGLPLSSINSIRNGVAVLVWPADRVQRNPARPNVTRTCWRLATPAEQARQRQERATQDTLRDAHGRGWEP